MFTLYLLQVFTTPYRTKRFFKGVVTLAVVGSAFFEPIADNITRPSRTLGCAKHIEKVNVNLTVIAIGNRQLQKLGQITTPFENLPSIGEESIQQKAKKVKQKTKKLLPNLPQRARVSTPFQEGAGYIQYIPFLS